MPARQIWHGFTTVEEWHAWVDMLLSYINGGELTPAQMHEARAELHAIRQDLAAGQANGLPYKPRCRFFDD